MKRGKYGAVVDNYPRLGEEDPKRADRIRERKEELLKDLGAGDASTLASLVDSIRLKKDSLKEVISQVQLDLDAATQLMIAKFEEDDIASIRLNTGRSISVEYELTAKVEDREVFRLWCIENGLERELRLWPSTTDSMVKTMIMEGKKEPPGTKVFSRTTTVHRS